LNAYPYSPGFWLTATGALLVNISLVVGEFARTGWLPYPRSPS
jgi:cytochrome o ubiquinol oxidase subunit 1